MHWHAKAETCPTVVVAKMFTGQERGGQESRTGGMLECEDEFALGGIPGHGVQGVRPLGALQTAGRCAHTRQTDRQTDRHARDDAQ
jgi:hypothetical protein